MNKNNSIDLDALSIKRQEIADKLLNEIQEKFPKTDHHHSKLFYRYPGLRLTPTGVAYLQKLYKIYEYDGAEYCVSSLNNNDLIVLHQKMVSPYYFGLNKFILFSGPDAMRLQFAGNLKEWIKQGI